MRGVCTKAEGASPERGRRRKHLGRAREERWGGGKGATGGGRGVRGGARWEEHATRSHLVEVSMCERK